MTFLDKLKLITISILTLGIYPIVIFSKKKHEVANQLSVASKIKLNINELIKNLGGKDNIVGAEYTHTKIKISIAHRNQIDLELLKKIKGITGIFVSRHSVTVIVGNQAKLIAEKLIHDSQL